MAPHDSNFGIRTGGCSSVVASSFCLEQEAPIAKNARWCSILSCCCCCDRNGWVLEEQHERSGSFFLPVDTKHKLLTLTSLIAVVLQKLLNVLPPLVMKHAVDVISEHTSTIAASAAVSGNAVLSPCMSAHASTVTARRIMLACAAYLGLKVLIMVTSVVQNLSKQVVSFDAERRFGIVIFSHLQQLGLSHHLSKQTGELTRIMNRFTESVTTILNQLVFFLAPTFLEALFVSACFGSWGHRSLRCLR
mmetsp:Transcript_22612/g.27641  ORF Transcript_22612/g.27641 Transcript_22612/m.27641 type:complete len:248 (+) Transcript_22612:444-1187(+)